MPRKLKCKIYKTVVRPVMLYGAEGWAVRKEEEDLMRRTENEMLRWIFGVTGTLKDRIRNEIIRERCRMVCITGEMREARLRWFGHVQRKEDGNELRRVMEMDVDGQRSRGRPHKR